MNAPILALSATTPLIANREFKLPTDGWMQLFRYAEVPAPIPNPDGKSVNVVQVIDAQAADAVLSSFRHVAAQPNFGGVLVDFEHFSLDTSKESRSAAWIDELQKREDGVWFRPRITNSGRSAIEGGDYRYISPVFEFPRRTYQAGDRVRPTGLHSAGLTNDPRIKGGVPISNRDGNSAGAAEKTKTEPTMNQLLKALGLAEGASEESAVAALQVITNRASTAESQLTAITKERDTLLTAQVDADLEKYKNRYKPENKETIRKALVANRAGTIELLESVEASAAVAETVRVTNRAAAKTPADIAAEEVSTAERALGQKIANRAGELRSQNPRLTRAQAFAKAEAELSAK